MCLIKQLMAAIDFHRMEKIIMEVNGFRQLYLLLMLVFGLGLITCNYA